MRRLVLLLGLSLVLLPAAAVAQTIGFAAIGGGGTWTWAGGSDLTGNSGDIGAFAAVNGSNFALVFYDGTTPVLTWDSGTISSGTDGYVEDFSGGTISINTGTGGSYCSSGTCFSGSLDNGGLGPTTLGLTPAQDITQLSFAFVNGIVDPGLLAALGLPTNPDTYAGQFSVYLLGNLSGCSTDTPCTGTWDITGLELTPVPEPGTLTLLGTGLLGLAGLVRRKLKKERWPLRAPGQPTVTGSARR